MVQNYPLVLIQNTIKKIKKTKKQILKKTIIIVEVSGLDFFDIIGWVYEKTKKRILKKTDFFDIIGWVYEKTKKRILKKTAIIVEVSGLDFFNMIE